MECAWGLWFAVLPVGPAAAGGGHRPLHARRRPDTLLDFRHPVPGPAGRAASIPCARGAPRSGPVVAISRPSRGASALHNCHIEIHDNPSQETGKRLGDVVYGREQAAVGARCIQQAIAARSAPPIAFTIAAYAQSCWAMRQPACPTWNGLRHGNSPASSHLAVIAPRTRQAGRLEDSRAICASSAVEQPMRRRRASAIDFADLSACEQGAAQRGSEWRRKCWTKRPTMPGYLRRREASVVSPRKSSALPRSNCRRKTTRSLPPRQQQHHHKQHHGTSARPA